MSYTRFRKRKTSERKNANCEKANKKILQLNKGRH